MSVYKRNEGRSEVVQHLNELRLVLLKLEPEKVGDIARIVCGTYENGGRLFTCGNGGSSSIASHLVVDLTKGLFQDSGLEIDAYCLTDNIPTITAWANDNSYDIALAAQLTPNRVQPEDCLLVFSGSGNSKNVLNAVEKANELKMMTVGISGFGGGKLQDMAQYSLVVESHDMQIVEDVFSVIAHSVFKAIRASGTSSLHSHNVTSPSAMAARIRSVTGNG